ncbi:hypothetical protein ACIGFK_38245 [Streptomyces sp. NPDC085524]|uniref:hypothetical protein n=1 Tax=unclassified Streptomyces TaxID=2593676 RepID=UPI0035D87693
MAEPTQAEVPALLAELKKYVMGGPVSNFVETNPATSKLVTEKFLVDQLAPLKGIVEDIKEIKGEVVNPLPVEMLQQLRMETLAAAVKKIIEGNDEWWKYVVTAGIGIFVTLVSGALLVRIGNAINNRVEAILNRIRPNPNGNPGIAPTPTAADLETLRAKLEEMTPFVQNFNKEAKRLPRARELAARAKAVEKLGKAAEAQNNDKVREAADAIRSLKTALRNFDQTKLPRDHSVLAKTANAINRLDQAVRRLNAEIVKNAASAIRNLKGALKNFNASDIPKAGPMRATARAARSLNSATRDLATSLSTLGTEATQAAGRIG